MADDISDKVQKVESEQKPVSAPSIKQIKNNYLPWYWTAAALAAGILFTNVIYYISPPSFLKNRIEESRNETNSEEYKKLNNKVVELYNCVDIVHKHLIEHSELPGHLRQANFDLSLFEGKKKIALDKSRIEKAVVDIEKYTAIISSNATDTEKSKAYAERGRAKQYLSLTRDAMTDLDKSVELDPSSADAHCSRGEILLVFHDKLKDALADIDEAIKLKPNFSDAYLWRGEVLYHLGFDKETMQALDKAIELDPKNGYAYSDRGLLKMKLGLAEEAILEYDKAIAFEPDFSVAYFNRGIAKKKLKLLDEAIADFDRAIEMDPYSPFAYYERGEAYAAKGEKESAEIDRASYEELKKICDLFGK